METNPCAVRIKIINDNIEREVNNSLREQNLTAVQVRVLFLLLLVPILMLLAFSQSLIVRIVLFDIFGCVGSVDAWNLPFNVLRII